MNRQYCRKFKLLFFVLAASYGSAQALQTPAFSANIGSKSVSVTSLTLPASFTKAALYCQIGDGEPIKTELKAPPEKPPAEIPCGGNLTAATTLTVTLEVDGQVVTSRPQSPVAKGTAKSKKISSKTRHVEAAVNGPNTLLLATIGFPGPVLGQIAIRDASGALISSGAPTGNRDGTYSVPVNKTPKAGDQIIVMIGDIPWSTTVQAKGEADGNIRIEFTPDPKDTQTAVSGTLSGDIATLSRVQSVYVEVLNGVGDQADVVQGPLDGKYSSSTYSFTVSNLKALAEGQFIHVHLCGAASPVSFTGTTKNGSAVITGVDPAVPLVAGGAVKGSGIPDGATILSLDTGNKKITISQNATADGTAVALQFFNGQSCSQAGPQSGSGGSGAKAALVEIIPANPATEVISLYDLGRVKTYFSVGAEFQGSNGSLGSTSGFLGFNIDENWITTGNDMKGLCWSAGDSGQYKQQIQRQNDDRDTCGMHQTRILVNSYVEAELTQIPLSSNGGSGQGSNTPSPATSAIRAATTGSGGSGSGGSGGSGSPSLNVASAKGAYVEGGAYMPILFKATQWTFRGQSNGFFVAPMGKYIFLDPDTTPAGATTGFNVYRAYAGGLRVGHFRLPSHFDKQNPELLSYADLTWGKWENFRETNGSRGTRFDVKARYKIPYTLLYIGFEANVGPGGSDYKLFAGTRVDVSSILGKLLPSGN